MIWSIGLKAHLHFFIYVSLIMVTGISKYDSYFDIFSLRLHGRPSFGQSNQ